tara:strand:- start:1526 stop:1957 length:432 start_codon:yes stop_codon:yes gene_type:complete
MWNKFLILLLVSYAPPSLGSEGSFTFVQKGARAPFTGTLFDPDATARLLANDRFKKEEYNLKLGFELQKQENRLNLQIDQLKISLSTQQEFYESTLKTKNTEIEQLNKIIKKKPGTNALLWGIAGGFAAGVAATIGITYAVNK